MSVDFMVCDTCREVFSDCESYEWCDECHNHVCELCVSAKGLDLEKNCPFCAKDIVTDAMILEFFWTLVDKERIVEIIKRGK